MEKIEQLDFEINEKVFKILLLVGIAVIVCYLGITLLSFAIPTRYYMEENTVLDSEGVVKNGVNHLQRGRFLLKLSAWAYKEGQSVKSFNNHFVLKSVETEKMYLMKAAMNEIPQLQFIDGQDCLKSGMTGRCVAVGLKNGMYDLYILYQNDYENLLVNTNVQVEI